MSAMNEASLNLLPQIALAAALSWGAGLRLYAVLFLTGLAQYLGWIDLPGQFAVLASPLVLWASGCMTLVEFFADKIPWVDSVWDAVHTFIRIPAGAALAASVFGDSGAGTTLAIALLGGTLAAGAHFAKAGTRAAANTSPEPMSNWTLSCIEDALVPAGLWLAVTHPVMFLIGVAAFAIGALLLMRWIARGLASLVRRYRTAREPVN